MLKLKTPQQVMVIITDRWNGVVIGMSKNLLEKDYDSVGLDLDDWDVNNSKPESPGIYIFDFCFSEKMDDDFPDDFWLDNPKLIYDFKSVDGLLA